MQVNRNDVFNPSLDRVTSGKYPTVCRTRSNGNDPFRVRGSVVSTFQRLPHALGHGPGDHEHIGMARRGDEVQPEPLDVIVGVVQRVDLQLAAVARAGVDLADRQAAPELALRGGVERLRQAGKLGVDLQRRFGERRMDDALEDEIAHLRLRDRGRSRNS